MMENLFEYNTLGLTKDNLVKFAIYVEKTRDFDSKFNGINMEYHQEPLGTKASS